MGSVVGPREVSSFGRERWVKVKWFGRGKKSKKLLDDFELELLKEALRRDRNRRQRYIR